MVRDANGQIIAWVYARVSTAEAMQPRVLTVDEARRIATNIARLRDLLRQADENRGRDVRAARSEARITVPHGQ